MVEGKPAVNFLRAMLYLSPTLILLGIFTFYPVFHTFTISFQEGYNYMKGTFDGWGFGNYEILFKTTYLKPTLLNTMLIVFVSVPLSLILSLLIAVALNSIKAFKKILQTIFFLPYVTNTIAIGMVFAVMFESEQGLVNAFIRMCGGMGINWLGSPTRADNPLGLLFKGIELSILTPEYLTSFVVLLIYIVWNSLPFKILILLSSLQGIDKQYYQAAQIDGASKFKTFMNITVPFVSPQLVYLTITSFIGAWKEYSSIDAIFGTGGGRLNDPGNMSTVVWRIYQYVGGRQTGTSMGIAAALAVLLFVIILLFTALNRYISNKKVHY